MNLVDLLILLLVAASAIHGLMLGAAVQVLSFGGFLAGLALGAAIAPRVANLTDSPALKASLSLLTLFMTASLVGGVGRAIGVRVWGSFRRLGIAKLDAVFGAVLSGGGTLVASWLVASMLASAPAQPLAGEIQQSAVVRAVAGVMPPAPDIFSRIRRLIEPRGFPDVFAQLERRPSEPLPGPAAPEVRAAVARASAATVKIVAPGCGGVHTGSGFVAAAGLVVTNAHVVAGVDDLVVIDGRGRHSATAVVFDPGLDIAILRTSGLAAGPLPLVPNEVGRGTTGAVLGYPGGGPLRAGPAAVLARYSALGRDIYSRGLVRRSVYELQTDVRPGNSGGPLVRTDGAVLGVVFSRSSTDPDIGYAITSTEVAPRLQSAQARRGAVDTGPCAA